MTDKIFSNTAFSQRASNKAQPILDDIKANPGTTRADIESRTSTNTITTGAMLQALLIGEQITERMDAGVAKYWAVGAWADSTWNLVPQIANYLETVEDPANVDVLASAFSVTEAEVYGASNVGDAIAALKLAER